MNIKYIELKTGEEYWISGVKKNGCDRHWLGHGKVIIDRKVIDEYLAIIQSESLKESQFEIQDIDDVFPIERIHAILNEQSEKKRNAISVEARIPFLVHHEGIEPSTP